MNNRSEKISRAARIAKQVADSIAEAMAPPKLVRKRPNKREKIARRRNSRQNRGAEVAGAEIAVAAVEPPAVVAQVPAARTRRAYATSCSARDLVRARAQAAAHLYVTPVALAAARKRAKVAHDRSRKLNVGARRFLINRVKKDKFLDCMDMRRVIAGKYNKQISNSTIYNCLSEHKITYKQTSLRTKPTDAGKLKEFRERIEQTPLDSIVSLDESSFDTQMVRKRGWSPVGEKCIVIPRNGGKGRKRFSLMMAVSSGEVIAWQVLEGSYNKERFLSYLRDVLLPVMQTKPHLKHLLMDNVAFHRSKEVRTLLDEHEMREPVIYNPPYHPDSNPVEMVFSVIKSLARKRGPRNQLEVEAVIEESIAADRFNLPAMFQHALAGRYLHE